MAILDLRNGRNGPESVEHWIEQARRELDRLVENDRERSDTLIRAHYALGKVSALSSQGKNKP